jgi:Protein of unknown function (DUF551)
MTWQPIETAPKDVVALFWIRPGTLADGKYFVDTSGNPILSSSMTPRIFMGKVATWSSLEVATHWMPLPAPPEPPK